MGPVCLPVEPLPRCQTLQSFHLKAQLLFLCHALNKASIAPRRFGGIPYAFIIFIPVDWIKCFLEVNISDDCRQGVFSGLFYDASQCQDLCNCSSFWRKTVLIALGLFRFSTISCGYTTWRWYTWGWHPCNCQFLTGPLSWGLVWCWRESTLACHFSSKWCCIAQGQLVREPWGPPCTPPHWPTSQENLFFLKP